MTTAADFPRAEGSSASLLFPIYMSNLQQQPVADRGLITETDRFVRSKLFDSNFNFEGCFEGYFGENGFYFPKIFQKTLKNTKIRILYPKKYDEHAYNFTMEVSLPGGYLQQVQGRMD